MPFNEPAGSGGVSIAAVPIWEPAGQAMAALLPLLNCWSVQAVSFGAAAGLRPRPAGSVTLTSRTFDWAIVAPESKGTLRSTVGPTGESVCLLFGSTAVVGVKGT